MLTARIKKLLNDLNDAFWLVPALMVGGGVIAAVAFVEIDRSGLLPQWLLESSWLYNGSATGARTLLGAVASSAIGVAGTVFSITIAALSLAAAQMGPRLLRNFTRDRGNQVTLGIFLGTFAYALVVLRTVRTPSEGDFVPHLALSVGILLALACVATLVYFVGHMSGRINVDVVVDLVAGDVRSTLARLTSKDPRPAPPPEDFWRGAETVRDSRRGYLQELDSDGLADWAAERGIAIRLLVRPGDHVFPGAPIALVSAPTEGVEQAIRDATALGAQRVSSVDLEFAVRQLVEVAVRALSPGINDPHTAISVLDRLGASLCELAPLHLPTSVWLRDGRPALVAPAIDYSGLTDAMFHMIRQNGASQPAVLIRLLEVLTAVVQCEGNEERVRALERHAGLALLEGERSGLAASDLDDVRNRHAIFVTTRRSRAAAVEGLRTNGQAAAARAAK